MATNARPFLDTLRDLGHGTIHDLLSDGLQELVAAVASEGRGGKLVFTINLKPLGKGDALVATPEIVVKAPRQALDTTVFYPTPENNLVREDPRQQKLELRNVPALAAKGVA